MTDAQAGSFMKGSIARVNALIPNSVTPATRIEIHPALSLTDEIARLERELKEVRAEMREAQRGGMSWEEATR